MLWIVESLVFAALVVLAMSQVIAPALAGRALFPLLRMRRARRDLAAARELRDEAEIKREADALVRRAGRKGER